MRRRGDGTRLAAWLGLAGILFQALLPLLIASVSLAEAHAAPTDGVQSAIHKQHGGHAPAPHGPPAGHQHGQAHCVLCLGLHAVGPMAVPEAVALVLPREIAGTLLAGRAAIPQFARPPAAYASRAPPAIG